MNRNALYSRKELETFFDLYDSLENEAETLVTDQLSFQAGQNAYKRETEELQKIKKYVTTIISFVKEQNDRIELVSTHWFYGNTLYQPQLWLRGGCQGKIERAKEKLEKAKKALPAHEQAEVIQTEKAMAANRDLQDKKALFHKSSNADKELKRMKKELVEQNPSCNLHSLVQDAADLEAKIVEHKQKMNQLEVIGLLLNDTKRCIGKVESHVKAFKCKMTEVDQLSKEEGLWKPFCSSGTTARSLEEKGRQVIKKEENYGNYTKYDACGNVVLTNKPCPNGCGFVVTFHPTHCCAVCARNGRSGGSSSHGPKCERMKLESMEGPTALWRKIQEERRIHEEKMEEIRHQAKLELQDAAREVQNAFEMFGRASKGFHKEPIRFFFPPIVPERCCEAEIVMQTDQLRMSVTTYESILSLKLQPVIEEGENLQHALSIINSKIDDEKNVIFESLRSTVSNRGEDNASDKLEEESLVAPIATATAILENDDDPLSCLPVVNATLIDDANHSRY